MIELEKLLDAINKRIRLGPTLNWHSLSDVIEEVIHSGIAESERQEQIERDVFEAIHDNYGGD